MTKDNIPDKWVEVGLIAVNILIYIWIALAWHNVLNLSENSPGSELERENSGIILVQGNSIKASSPPVMITPQVLGMLTRGIEIREAELLNKIAECESDWRNVCNSKGCKYGQGVFQLIPSTVKYCEEKLGKSIDPFNEENNLECATWLLLNESWEHWGTPTSNWGTYWCWHEYIN